MATYDYLKSKNGHKIQVESAKRDGAGKNIENNYAKQNGYYAQLTAGLADNLAPYSEDSGVHQENPFISNGTGTNNNKEIVTVGDYALVEQKQGNTVCVNQLVSKDVMASSSSYFNVTYTNNNDGTVTANGQNSSTTNNSVFYAFNHFAINSTHTYLVRGCPKINGNLGSTSTVWVNIASGKNDFGDGIVVTGLSEIAFRISIAPEYSVSSLKFIPQVIDLTQWGFTADEITDITAHPEHFFWYYNGSLSYNTGSLENANGVKLVSTGRNQFDQSKLLQITGFSKSGDYIVANATDWSSNANFLSLLKAVIPNQQYYVRALLKPSSGVSGARVEIRYTDGTDTTGTIIGSNTEGVSTAISTANKVISNIRVTYSSGSTSTISVKDITISLYYTPAQGGEGYEKYYPYEEPTIVDTGTETLLSVGSVRSYKTKDGTIHRLVGSYTFTGEETIQTSTDGRFYYQGLLSLIKKIANTDFANIILVGLDVHTKSAIHNYTNAIAVDSEGYVWFRLTADTTNAQMVSFLTGKTVYYELAQETTEQGTPYPETLPINDYGMLYWLDENDNLVGIPQGVKIFFPVNYKGFVDDVYSRTDGDAGNLVLQEELQESETTRDTVDAQLLNAIGGTLRQCLCVKESLDFDNTAVVDLGSLSDWSYNGTRFLSLGISTIVKRPGDNDVAKIICTKYERNSLNQYTDKQIAIGSGGPIAIKDSSYTNVDDFKAAMKGVLLAYEKA